MTEKTVPTTVEHEENTPTRAPERFLRPPVDIYETEDALMVVADLPGVAKEDVDVRVNDNILSLRGKTGYEIPGEAVDHEYTLMNFYREFELGEKVDRNNIGAELKHGVLTLRLPKVEEAKPRQIEVSVA
jgi:HSP20 family protein